MGHEGVCDPDFALGKAEGGIAAGDEVAACIVAIRPGRDTGPVDLCDSGLLDLAENMKRNVVLEAPTDSGSPSLSAAANSLRSTPVPNALPSPVSTRMSTVSSKLGARIAVWNSTYNWELKELSTSVPFKLGELFIGGKRISASSNPTFPIVNPATK